MQEEVGELARAIRDRNKLQIEVDDERQWDLEEEIVDVFNYILDIANYYDVNLEKPFLKKNGLKIERKWD